MFHIKYSERLELSCQRMFLQDIVQILEVTIESLKENTGDFTPLIKTYEKKLLQMNTFLANPKKKFFIHF